MKTAGRYFPLPSTCGEQYGQTTRFAETVTGRPFALSAAGAAKLPNTVVDPETAPLKKLPFGDARVYFEGATDQVRSMVGGSLLLAVGKSDPPQKHEEEEFMVIAEGTAEILVDGKTVRVKPGSMMYCGANKTHGIGAMNLPGSHQGHTPGTQTRLRILRAEPSPFKINKIDLPAQPKTEP